MHPIKSIYLPRDALQGSEFPGHIIWEPSIEVDKIIITLPQGVHLKEIYNVPKEGLMILEDSKIEISNFEANGYVGMVFQSKKLEDPHQQGKFNFKILLRDNDTHIEETRKILLFRPEILVSAPQIIEVYYNNKSDKYHARTKISIKNSGKGTAIIAILPSEDSEVKIRDPAEFEEFIERFKKDVKKRLSKLEKEHPDQKQFIEEFVILFEELSTEPTEIVTEFNKKIRELLEKDEEFIESFVNAIGESYFINLNMFMELSALLNFVRSSIGNNIFLLNPTSLLQLEKPISTLSLEVYITDLAGNEYKKIHSQVKIELKSTSPSKSHIRFPLYEIIKVEE